MKVEYLKEKLRWAIAAAEKVTGKNLSLPTLTYVLLEAKDRQLVIRATNLDVGLRITLPAKVAEDGQVLVSGAVMSNFLGSLYGEDKVELATVNNTLTVATRASSSVFKTYPLEDFPTIPEVKGGETIALPATKLLSGLRAVVYAASLSDIKPEIASVYLHTDGGDLVFAATDSFRLAEKRLRPEGKVPGEPKLIIPIKNVTEILRVFEGVDENLTVTYNNHQIALSTEQIYLTSRLVEGVFPDYRQIMPTKSATEAVVLKADLQNSLRLATIFSDKLNQITLRLLVGEKILELNSRNTDVGEASVQLSSTLQGDDLEISFNVRYLLDCLSAITTDSLSLSFNGKQKAIAIRAVGDSSFTYLIMPLNR